MPPDPSSVYDDDPTIGDDELLYRMVTRQSTGYVDGIAVRGGTNAFQDLPPDRLDRVEAPAVAVSVFLQSELSSNDLSPDDLVQSWRKIRRCLDSRRRRTQRGSGSRSFSAYRPATKTARKRSMMLSVSSSDAAQPTTSSPASIDRCIDLPWDRTITSFTGGLPGVIDSSGHRRNR